MKGGGISMPRASVQRSEFGQYLIDAIQHAHFSQRAFYEQVGIAKPYFYEIISGKVNPPPRETLERMLEVLNEHPSDEPVCRNTFLNLAAKCRQEIPVDINDMIMEHPEQWDSIRTLLNDMLNGRNVEPDNGIHS